VAHTTANGTTTDAAATDAALVKVQDYHQPATGIAQSRLDALLRRSERLVWRLAPSPATPAPDEYRSAARDAELAVFEHLLMRPSYVDQESVLDSSTRFSGEGALEELVRSAMPSYYSAPPSIAPSSDGYAGVMIF
jgi:hypothetical protein